MLIQEKHLNLRETHTHRQQRGWQKAGIQSQLSNFLILFSKRMKSLNNLQLM